jgi:hypothetical protein
VSLSELTGLPLHRVHRITRIEQGEGNGRTFQAIADGLIADGILTARGKQKWYSATVRGGGREG